MSRFLAIAASATFSVLSSGAFAVPVNVSIQSENTFLLPTAGTQINVLPNGTGGSPVVQFLTASSATARSPFEDSDGVLRVGYSGQQYTSVQANGAGVWNYSGNTLNILWGSPDSYNVIQFYSGANATGTLLGSIIGTDLQQATIGLNHDWVKLFVTSGIFQSVKLSSPGQNAFEFTQLESSCVGASCRDGAIDPTPIPGAALLMGSVLAGGVGGMQIMRRRRRVSA